MLNTTKGNAISTHARWLVVFLLMILTALGHFNREGLAVAGTTVFMDRLGITEVQMGWVYTTFLIFYTIGMLPGGWLIDRIGSVKALTLFAISMGTLVALTAMLSGLSGNPLILWIGLLILRGLTGICNAPLHPGAAHVASESMPKRHRATANGMRTAGALVGIAFSYPIFGGLIDRFDWPVAFVASGLALVACGVIWMLLVTPMIPAKQVTVSQETRKADSIAAWALLGQGNLWLLTLSYAAYGYFQYLFFYWMSNYFEKVLHLSDQESRGVSFYIFLAMGAGMAIGGLGTDVTCKLLGTIRGRQSIVMTGMVLGALFALLAVNMTDYRNVAVCLAISMGSLGMCEGVFWTTATDIGGKSRGFSGAFMNTGGNIGGLISPVLNPWMAKTIGWPGAITIACVIVALGGFLWFVIRPPESHQQDHQSQ